MPADSAPLPPRPLPLSPRRRRLRWTIASLALAALGGIMVGLVIYHQHRPKLYRPDEKLEDITSSLARNLPKQAPKPAFTDVTREAGLASFRTFIGDRTSQLPEDMGPGLAWGDFNNDGLDDLFLVSAGGPLNAPTEKLAPCELYENLGNGTFRKVTDFPETRIHGMGAAWGDYDGDGYLDLIVTGYNTVLLFHNEGGKRFVRDTRFPNLPGFWSSATWGDYDNDRCLDLYLCGYVQYTASEADRERMSAQIGTAVPFTLNPSSFSPALNHLFHNNGDGTFTDVSDLQQVSNPTGRSLGALWHDFDDDGWLDLYVANDISDNVLYHNRAGKFEDISHPAYVADYRSAMGLAAGDYDRDGDDDLFIGHWVGQENALYDNLLIDNRARDAQPQSAPVVTGTVSNRPAARPLYFMDVADMKGLGQIALAYVSWGAEFVDFDADGWLDLIVVNGNTLEQEGPLPRKLKPQESFLFWNDHGQYFYNLAPLNRSLAEPHVSRGMAVADYNNDGAMDIAISFLGEGVQLLRNDMQRGHWLKVRLRSRLKYGAPLGFGDGTKVIAHVGGAVLRRTVSSVSYLSQSSHTLHFGLGEAQRVDSLEVRWLGGLTNFFENLEANSTWEIMEGESRPRRFVPQPRQVSSSAAPSQASSSAAAVEAKPAQTSLEKARVLEFWQRSRAAMNALKIEKNNTKAIELLRSALELNPSHEDSLYYLGQCLAAEGDVAGALAQFDELIRINSHSHRGFRQWGVVRACTATSDAELAAAERSLEQAQSLNPEETGALLVLGEVSLLRGDLAKADERLAAACRTNPKAVGGFFLRGYLAWQRGDEAQARSFLDATRTALGKDWQPKGATSEGDVRSKQHIETTPLTRFWENWDGQTDPQKSYAPLAARLGQTSAHPRGSAATLN